MGHVPLEAKMNPGESGCPYARVIGLDGFQMAVNLFLVRGLTVITNKDFQCDVLITSD